MKKRYRVICLPCEDLEDKLNAIADEGYHIFIVFDGCVILAEDIDLSLVGRGGEEPCGYAPAYDPLDDTKIKIVMEQLNKEQGEDK